MDAVKEASKNISTLLHCSFATPPTPMRSVRKQKNKAKSHMDNFYTTINPKENLDVCEVWRFLLDNDEQDEVFVVLSAVCTIAGYRNVKWSDVAYRGFYSTVDEALNSIYADYA